MKKLCLILITLLLFALPNKTSAQENGITVMPSIAHIDLATDAPEYEITYSNNSKYQINLSLSVKDFTELEDSYRLSFLEGKEASNYKYSLSSWISFENKNISLSPGEKKSVKIFIDKERITKGGHYASILAELTQEESKDKVNVKAILSSLLFVRASTGKEIEDASISTFRPLRDAFEYPQAYVLRFENKGNVHVVPYGLIEVFDPLGKRIAKGILNEGSLDALPESIRRYDTKVITTSKILVPGFYKAKISIHYGKTNKSVSKEIEFFSFRAFDFKILILALVGLVGIMFVYKRLKRTK